MSHFTRVKTRLHDLDCLQQALTDLKLRHETGQVQVSNYYHQMETVDVLVHTNSDYNIGFKQQEDAYEMVADWWGVENHTPIRQKTFTDQVTQRYAYNMTVRELREHGLEVVDEKVTPENVIELTVHI
jgi:hypothetical protein